MNSAPGAAPARRPRISEKSVSPWSKVSSAATVPPASRKLDAKNSEIPSVYRSPRMVSTATRSSPRSSLANRAMTPPWKSSVKAAMKT